MHVDEERLQRLLHEELHAPDAAAIREHLVTCAECRARVEEARRDEDEVLTLLRDLDQPAVVVTAGDVTARARTHDARWLRAPWLRAAATIVLSAGLVGVAFAAPGSPLPRWFANLLVRVELQKSGERPPRERVRPQLAGSVAGISIEPGRELVVLFAESPARGEVVVSLFDGVEVEVRTAEGGARFTAGEERLVIDNRASSASFKVRIPRSARRVEMRLGSTRLLLKIGDRITAVVAPDSQGTYTIPLRAR